MRILTCFVALYLYSSVASAAVYTYILDDHPDGNKQNTYDYGLRLDTTGEFYTFQNGKARLIYDDDGGGPDANPTAVITGFVNQSTAVDQTSPTLTEIFYRMSGITDLGNGFFTASRGFGSVGDTEFGGKAMGGNVFIFDDDAHRLGGFPGWPTDIVGRGWVMVTDPDLAAIGSNDFLVTATLVPIPAAVWLFGSALLAFFGVARRKATA